MPSRSPLTCGSRRPIDPHSARGHAAVEPPHPSMAPVWTSPTSGRVRSELWNHSRFGRAATPRCGCWRVTDRRAADPPRTTACLFARHYWHDQRSRRPRPGAMCDVDRADSIPDPRSCAPIDAVRPAIDSLVTTPPRVTGFRRRPAVGHRRPEARSATEGYSCRHRPTVAPIVRSDPGSHLAPSPVAPIIATVLDVTRAVESAVAPGRGSADSDLDVPIPAPRAGCPWRRWVAWRFAPMPVPGTRRATPG